MPARPDEQLSMLKQFRDFVKTKPRLYDAAIRVQRALGVRPQSYDVLRKFSLAHNRQVSFIQIGANDGLRNDPVREFVVRDRWQGILIEPLPDVFVRLENNYRHFHHLDMHFINAAISSDDASELSFWTFNDVFLSGLPLEERLDCQRKASFDKDHVRKFFESTYHRDFSEVALDIKVPCLSLNQIITDYRDGQQVDILIIDAEGHEKVIIESIDFDTFNPEAIFFESHHLGAKQDAIYGLLKNNGFTILEVGGDAMAFRGDSMMP